MIALPNLMTSYFLVLIFDLTFILLQLVAEMS